MVFDVDSMSRALLESRVEVQRIAAAGGVRSPALIEVEACGGLCAALDLPGHVALVMARVDGPDPSRRDDLRSAMAIGEQLGRLHSLRIPIAVVPSVAPADPKIETLLAGIPAEHAPGAQIAADLIVRYPPPRPSIIGHCDLDWKNVVFTDQRAVILDWAQAAPVVPSAELAAATIEWSGFRLGEPDVAAARGLLRADHKAGGVGTVDGIASFTPWVLEELTWLAECAEAPSRQESELAWFAKHFYRVLTQLPEWADALRTKR